MPQTDFFSDVYEVVRLVPRGRATSYGAIASYLGSPKNARVVGWAMGACTGVLNVPAHRVVNSKGVLSAKAQFGPGDEMSRMLQAEGVQIENDQILNWKEIFWDPSEEL